MDKPVIFGGVGEYGRACFYLEIPKFKFLLDAGIMKGKNLREEDRLPRIPKALIPEIDGVFLSHSHEDHVGALPYLVKHGFSGILFSSEETKEQILDKEDYAQALKNIPWKTLMYHGEIGTCTISRGREHSPITLTYGSSGHMIGAMWLSIQWDHQRGFYSGDYSMDSFLYREDPPIKEAHQWGIIDGAYENQRPLQSRNVKNMKSLIKEGIRSHRKLVFPLPVKGRGLELSALLAETLVPGPPEESKGNTNPVTIYADQSLLKEMQQGKHRFSWLHNKGRRRMENLLKAGEEMRTLDEAALGRIFTAKKEGMMILLGDSKMEGEKSRELYNSLDARDRVVFTGNPGKNTFGERLLNETNLQEDAPQCILQHYNVHLTENQGITLGQALNIKDPILFHHPSLTGE